MGETHEIPHHNLADFEPWLGYVTEGQAVGGIPLQIPLEGPQYHPQLHLLHSATSKNPHAMAEMGKLDHLKKKISESRLQRLFKENVRKTKRGLRIFKIMVRKLFTHREDINTPRVRRKERQPLIECAQCDFQNCLFSQ